MSNVVKKVKKQAISLGFFHILLGEYLLKQKVVVVKSSKWKFITVIARNTKFIGLKGQMFALFVSKMKKN